MANDEVFKSITTKELHIGGAEGDRSIKVPSIQANGTNNISITNVAPSGVGTPTIAGWLCIHVAGSLYYIPAWT